MGINKAQTYKPGQYRDYTNSSGDTIDGGTLVEFDDGMVGLAEADIANGEEDAVLVTGQIKIEKKNEAMKAGLPVGYDSDGSPYGGTASSGAATVFLADADMVPGSVVYDVDTTDTHVIVELNKFTKAFPYWPNRTYETKTAAYTIDAQDTGKVIQDATDNAVLTMTAVAGIVGCDVVIQNMADDGDAKLSINPNSSDKVAGPDIGGTDNKDLINTKATQEQGDFVHLIAGTDWFVKEIRGTWATEA